MKKNKEKVIYEVDPHNRLVVKSPDGYGVRKFRQVYDGYFYPDEKNSLYFHIKKSEGIDTPEEVKFSGSWALNDNHDLVFTLDKWNNQVEGNALAIKGDIISVSGSLITFGVSTKDITGGKIYLIKISGIWKRDPHNRLSFNVARVSGKEDTLTFNTAWQINKFNEISYVYYKKTLKRSEKIRNEVKFKGFWDIIDKYRIAYVIDRASDSGFEFEAKVSNIVLPKDKRASDGRLEFDIGIGVIPKKQTMKIFGKWVFDKKLGLFFEVEYGSGLRNALLIGADYKLTKDLKLSVTFKNRTDKDSNLGVELSRKLLGLSGEIFLKTFFSDSEKALFVGGAFKF